MKNPGWRRWSVLVAFALVVTFTGFFAVRTVRRAIYWHYHQDEPIRPWMSLGYVAHSYSVPPWVLHKALGLPNRPDRRPIRAIAHEQNRSVEEVTAVLQDAIVHVRPPYPPPGPPPPPDNEPTRGRSP